MSEAFERAWAFIHMIEGGDRITDDPHDPGGLTKHGFSQRSYPQEDIRNLTEDRAKELFARDYWNACKCDELPEILAVAVADCGFNQGVGTAIRLLQETVKTEPDGVIGPNTIGASKRLPASHLVNELLSRRALRYANGNSRYQRGWFLRLFKLREAL